MKAAFPAIARAAKKLNIGNKIRTTQFHRDYVIPVKHPVQLYTTCWLGAFALLSFVERLDFRPGKPFAFNVVIPSWHYGTADSLAHGGRTDGDMAAGLSATTRDFLP